MRLLPALAALYFAAGGGASVQAAYRGAECHATGALTTPSLALRSLMPCALWKLGAFDGAPAAAWTPPCSAFDGKRFIAGVWGGGACSPDFPSPASLRAFLAGKRLLVRGDSVLRQLFMRLVFLLREQDVALDPWFHSAAAYTFNASGHDALDIGADAARLARVAAPTFEARFAWDTDFDAFDADAVAAENWTLVVASPVYWRLDTAAGVFAQLARLPTVVMVTTPLVESFSPRAASAVQSRNAWVEQHNPRHLPLARMADSGAFLRNVEKDAKHFQCQFQHGFGHAGPDQSFKSPPSGDCRDLLNLNAVMMALAHIPDMLRAPETRDA